MADKKMTFQRGQKNSPWGSEIVPFQSKACGGSTGLLTGCQGASTPAAVPHPEMVVGVWRRQDRRATTPTTKPCTPPLKPAQRLTFYNLYPRPARICENDGLTMSTDNLLSLKDDMVAFIEGHGLHRLPGYVTEDIPSILWEGQDNPDAWKDFVEMAKHVGAAFVTFSEMTLDREELDALIEQASEMNFPDEEAAELVEAKWLRKYAGMVGYIQLGFVYQGLVFLHETTTEWYERFQTLVEDIESFQDIVIDDSDRDDEDE